MALIRTVLAIAIVSTSALALAACGEGAGGDDPAEISAVLERAFVGFDASACEEVFTPRALEQITFDEDEDPLENCKEDASPDDNADSIEIELSVSGPQAQALVTPDGGDMNGVAVNLRLVERDGWRIDRLGRLEVLDHGTFVDSLMRELASPDPSFTAAEHRCIRGWFTDRTSDGEFARIFVDGELEFMLEAVRNCIGDGTDSGTLATGIKRRLIYQLGLSPSEARCVLSAIGGQLKRFSLEDSDDVFTDPALGAAVRRAYEVCLGSDGPSGEAPRTS